VAAQQAQRRALGACPAQSLIELIAFCLRQGCEPGADGKAAGGGACSTSYRAFLCGPVEHFSVQSHDSGWGCGWRNMQMLISHVLATRPVRGAAAAGGSAEPRAGGAARA
jgi:hypothetical protein